MQKSFLNIPLSYETVNIQKKQPGKYRWNEYIKTTSKIRQRKPYLLIWNHNKHKYVESLHLAAHW